MTVIKIKLNSVNDVKEFVNQTAKFSGDILVCSERYKVDGKSIMGLFSLNTSSTLTAELSDDSDLKLLDSKFVVA